MSIEVLQISHTGAGCSRATVNATGNSQTSQEGEGGAVELPNTAENLLLQIACSRLGVAFHRQERGTLLCYVMYLEVKQLEHC